MWGCVRLFPAVHEMLVKLRSLGECETTNLTPQNDLIYCSNDPKTAILVRNNPRSRHRRLCSCRGPKWISYSGLFANLFSNRISVRTFDDFVPKWGNIFFVILGPFRPSSIAFEMPDSWGIFPASSFARRDLWLCGVSLAQFYLLSARLDQDDVAYAEAKLPQNILPAWQGDREFIYFFCCFAEGTMCI